MSSEFVLKISYICIYLQILLYTVDLLPDTLSKRVLHLPLYLHETNFFTYKLCCSINIKNYIYIYKYT